MRERAWPGWGGRGEPQTKRSGPRGVGGGGGGGGAHVSNYYYLIVQTYPPKNQVQV